MALTESQIDRCRGEGFIPMPEQVKVDGTHSYHVCPWGCKNYATISRQTGVPGVYFLPARPIHCYHCERMAWVNMVEHIEGEIQSEEQKTFDILAKFKDVKAMSAKDAVIAWHSKGLPYELAEDLADDEIEFRRLADEHRSTGGNSFKSVY